MFTNQSGRKESEATWTCRTVTPPCNVNLPHLATQHCISLCTYSMMSTKVIDFSVLVWLAYFSSDYSQLTAAPKGLQRKQDSLQAGCPYHCLTNSVKTLKGTISSMLLIWNLLHPTMPSSYNSQYFKITWVNWFQNVNPFWILLQQEMLGGAVVPSRTKTYKTAFGSPPPTYNHTLFISRFPFCHPINSIEALKAEFPTWQRNF